VSHHDKFNVMFYWNQTALTTTWALFMEWYHRPMGKTDQSDNTLLIQLSILPKQKRFEHGDSEKENANHKRAQCTRFHHAARRSTVEDTQRPLEDTDANARRGIMSGTNAWAMKQSVRSLGFEGTEIG
jgi:hypothetical protein